MLYCLCLVFVWHIPRWIKLSHCFSVLRKGKVIRCLTKHFNFPLGLIKYSIHLPVSYITQFLQWYFFLGPLYQKLYLHTTNNFNHYTLVLQKLHCCCTLCWLKINKVITAAVQQWVGSGPFLANLGNSEQQAREQEDKTVDNNVHSGPLEA